MEQNYPANHVKVQIFQNLFQHITLLFRETVLAVAYLEVAVEIPTVAVIRAVVVVPDLYR